jgi:PAS domain S-box-containing protein
MLRLAFPSVDLSAGLPRQPRDEFVAAVAESLIRGKRLTMSLRTSLLVAACLVFGWHISEASDLDSSLRKTVLAVYSLHRDSPLNVAFDSGLQRAFKSSAGTTVDYYSEFMDSRRFSSETDLALMREYLRQKYATRKIDVIVAFGSAAAELLMKNREDLLPDVPVVFCAAELEVSGRHRAQTGLVWGADHRATLEVALRLHPATSDVFVVLDPPPETSIFSTELQEELRAFESKAAFHYLIDLPTQDVIAKLNAAPPTSILLYVRQARDLAGHRVPSTDALKLIADAVNMPTYGAYDAYLGAGVIGGYVFSSPANGARVGDMALRVASGANIEDIPIERALAVPQFDWRQLQRWHIRDSQLPAGSIVLFRQFTFWDQYKRYIVAAASLFAIQLALMGGLLVQRARRRRAELAWQESEERYRTFVTLQQELVCRYRPDLTLTYVNGAYCRFWEKQSNELIGTSFLTLLPESSHAEVRAYVKSLVDRPRVDSREFEIRAPDGSTCWQQWINHVIVDSDGRAVEIQGIGKDVTERKLSEEALHQSEARNRAILRAVPDMMFLLNRAGVYLDYQAKDPRDLFSPPEQFLGKNIRDVMPPHLVPLFLNCLDRAAASEEPCVIDYELPLAGENRHFELRMVSCDDDKILSIVRDMTARRRTERALRDNEAELQATNEEIRHLGGRLIAAQEDERRRIARELHDDLSQKLALLTMELDQLSQTPSNEEAAQRLRRLTDQAGQIATDVHRLSYQLHPSKLEALGLVASIRSYCRDIELQHAVEVEFTHTDMPVTIPAEVSLCVFRVVQEALHNVVKHSSARSAFVRLSGTGNGLQLQMADSGVGFTLEGRDGQGLGLVSMRERVHFLGGKLVIHSAPGDGTRIGVRVPFDTSSGADGTVDTEVRTA